MAGETTNAIFQELKGLADPEHARRSQRYFRTAAGEYGAGDRFLGLRVPDIRKIARRHPAIALVQVSELLQSEFHESRLLALVMLVNKYKKASDAGREEIHNFYMKNRQHVNNWDLVDSSAPVIVGEYLLNRPRNILFDLTRSPNLWDRRIAVLSTFTFIRNGDFTDALKICAMLLRDKHDLVHKAVGWMLREIGKQDRQVEENFLFMHYREMPRTMLRYAIEKFPRTLRLRYLHGTIAN